MPTAKLCSFYPQRRSLFSLQSPGGNRRQQIPQVQAVPDCSTGFLRENVGLWQAQSRYVLLERKQLAHTETKKLGEILVMFHLINYYIKMRTEASSAHTNTYANCTQGEWKQDKSTDAVSYNQPICQSSLCKSHRIKNNQTLLTHRVNCFYMFLSASWTLLEQIKHSFSPDVWPPRTASLAVEQTEKKKCAGVRWIPCIYFVPFHASAAHLNWTQLRKIEEREPATESWPVCWRITIGSGLCTEKWTKASERITFHLA